MKTSKMLGAAVVLLGVASGSAYAATLGEGFYVDGTIGRMTANIPSGSIPGLTKNDSDSTYSFGGGYTINKYFGIEVGYQNLGQVSYSWTGAGTLTSGGNTFVGTGAAKLSADIDGYYLGPTVSFPINEQFSVHGRAGWYRWEADLKISATAAGTLNGTPVAAGASASATTKETDTYFGLGATYKVNKNVGVSLGYTEYKVDAYKAKNWTLGARYSF